MTAGAPGVVEMRGIAKRFGPVQALCGADFSLAAGEVHALLGENGAGKSTLMHVLYGLVPADHGAVEVLGRPLPPGSPRAAMTAGLGMVHQHFSLVPRMSVAENVWLGRSGVRFPAREAADAVRRVGEETGLVLDPSALAEHLPAGLRQRLEIVKALARDVKILILDEPTALLAPAEVEDLFAALRRLVARGMSVVLITHKLREITAIADRVTILRQGTVVGTHAAGALGPADLARSMIGGEASEARTAEALEARRDAPASSREPVVLSVQGLSVRARGRPDPVRGVNFDVRAGEIVGLAAVEDNGQRELLRAVAGLQRFEGRVRTTGRGVVGFVPDDRQSEGLALDLPLLENLALGRISGFWLGRRALEHQTAQAIDQYDIRVGDTRRPVRELSGGNQQKAVLARVLGLKPDLIVAENPTRGLDLHATTDIHARLRRVAHEEGIGVLFHSSDLDEVLLLADRVAVLVQGRWRWVADAERSREGIGALMLSAAS